MGKNKEKNNKKNNKKKKQSKLVAGLFIIGTVSLTAFGWYILVKSGGRTVNEYDVLIEKGREYLEQGFYKDGTKELIKAEAIKKDTDVEIKIAETCYAIGDYTTSTAYADLVNGRTGGNEKMYKLLIDDAIRSKNYEEANRLINEGREVLGNNSLFAENLNQIKGEFADYYGGYNYLSEYFNGYTVATDIANNSELLNSEGNLSLGITANLAEIYGITAAGEHDGMWEDSGIIYAGKDGNGRVGFYDEAGAYRVSPIGYSYISAFRNGLVAAKNESGYVYLDKDFKVISEVYEDATTFCGGIAAVKRNGKWALINTEMKNITEFKYDDILRDEFNQCSVSGAAFALADGRYELISGDGTVIKKDIDVAKPFVSPKGYAAIFDENGWQAIDKAGNVIFKYDCDELGSSHIGILPYRSGELWGYVSIENGVIIEPVFGEAKGVNENGAAPVEYAKDGSEGSWTVIKFMVY